MSAEPPPWHNGQHVEHPMLLPKRVLTVTLVALLACSCGAEVAFLRGASRAQVVFCRYGSACWTSSIPLRLGA